MNPGATLPTTERPLDNTGPPLQKELPYTPSSPGGAGDPLMNVLLGREGVMPGGGSRGSGKPSFGLGGGMKNLQGSFLGKLGNF